MITIDLTQKINETMPVYPGTERPTLTKATTIEQEGFAEKFITMYSHTGTHMDAPAHMLKGAKTLDEYDVSQFIGRGIVIDAGRCAGSIPKELLESNLKGKEKIDFVLIKTNWSKRWGDKSYYDGFPVLDNEATLYMLSFRLKGIGLDCISVDPVGSTEMENHRAIMEKDMVIIENQCNLDTLVGEDFMFYCLPLRIEEADGSPVRAVGCIEAV